MELIINKKGKKYNYHESQVFNRNDNLYLSCVNDVFSDVECDNLIDISENLKYKEASLFTKNGKEYFDDYTRKSQRCIIDNSDFANKLLERIKHYIPHIYRGKVFHSINNRLRFLKYDAGGNFKRHSDGCYSDKNNNTMSMITILIYLNENYEGANTTFFNDSRDTKGFSLDPKIGIVCLMDQDIEHEVPPLLNGIKYAIRTELMYEI